jgi:hypothetical protein
MLAESPEGDILEAQAGEPWGQPDLTSPEQPAREPFKLDTYLIWAVLLAGALLFSLIALKLLKKEKSLP